MDDIRSTIRELTSYGGTREDYIDNLVEYAHDNHKVLRDVQFGLLASDEVRILYLDKGEVYILT